MSAHPIPECGTRPAYKRHVRLREVPDTACTAAEAAYRRDYNARRREAIATARQTAA